MDSCVLSSLVCVLCVILLPAAQAEYCEKYQDTSGRYHSAQQCYNQYCCGYCHQRACCSDQRYYLNQASCSKGTSHGNKGKLPTILGSTLGTLFPIALCVGVVICCVAPCCICYKKCRKGGNRGHGAVIHTPNVLPTPQPPFQPSRPDYPGYQPVPALPGFGGLPNPAPPPYNDPGYNPAAFNPGQPAYPFNGLFATPPEKNEAAQPPYNPAYDPNSVNE